MHNAHVIKMKQHHEMKPINMLKLLCLGIAINAIYSREQRDVVRRTVVLNIQRLWNQIRSNEMFNHHVYMYIYHNDLIDMWKQENANDIKHYDLAQARSLFLFTHYTLHITHHDSKVRQTA